MAAGCGQSLQIGRRPSGGRSRSCRAAVFLVRDGGCPGAEYDTSRRVPGRSDERCCIPIAPDSYPNSVDRRCVAPAAPRSPAIPFVPRSTCRLHRRYRPVPGHRPGRRVRGSRLPVWRLRTAYRRAAEASRHRPVGMRRDAPAAVWLTLSCGRAEIPTAGTCWCCRGGCSSNPRSSRHDSVPRSSQLPAPLGAR